MKNYYAFDFDGVICNSAGESGVTAWRAAHSLWPDKFQAEPDAQFRARFPRLRPVIETGHENVVVAALYAQGLSDEELIAQFPKLRDELMAREGLDVNRLRNAFGEARDRWIETDVDGWLDAQGFYAGVVEAINAMPAPRCIITTKEDRFTRVLVKRAGLQVDADRIYALESFEHGGKLSVLQKLASDFPDHKLHFFEDRLATLLGLTATSIAQLYLVDWGYNLPPERAQGDAHDSIELINMQRFDDLLKASN